MKTKFALLASTLVLAFCAMSGAAQADVKPQIIGGSPASEAYPFMASLQYKDPNRPSPQRCGATLISPHWLVTAAHCIADFDGNELSPAPYLIRIGSTDLLGGTVHEIERFVAHPYWGRGRESVADIGLIKLRQPAEQVYISNGGFPSPGTAVRTIGWGRTGTGEIPRQLQELDSTVLPYDDCIHGDPYDITPGDLCVDAPGGTASICGGDSGGPLLIKKQGIWHIVGVVSRSPGESGCLNGPPVFTSTDFAWHWILVQTLNDV